MDDTPANLQVLSGMLRNYGYRVRPVLSGRLALQAIEHDPPDLILLDITMPEMDGFEVSRRLKLDQRFKELPIIFISAHTDTSDKIKAFSAGGVDYIVKPFQIEEVQARIKTHLELQRLRVALNRHTQNLEELVQEQFQEIITAQMTTVFALAKLAESRDDETGRHIERVQVFCRMLAAWIGEHSGGAAITPPFIDNLYHASPLHDIGKVAIPDAILLKPARLTPAEFEILKQHTLHGARTLEMVLRQSPNSAFLKMGLEIARSHHERWDGKGYPDGLKGEEIPLSARIMEVIDVYDALRSKRSYKPAFSHNQSRSIILDGSGTHFDPLVTEAFLAMEQEIQECWITM